MKERNSKEIENATNKETNKTRAYFQDQFRQKRTNLSEEYRDWQEVYEPKTTIKEEWYKGLDEEILEQEWVDMLKKLKGKSAPGQSDRYVNFCNSEIREESTNSIMRFLGIWLNTKMKETFIKAKAKGIVRAMVISLYPKKLTWRQLAYLNNEIYRPLLKLIKNKAELQVTTSTSLLKHKGLGNCTEALATELRLRQRFNDARIVNVMSDLEKIDNIKKIWKFNLACLVLLKAKELKFHFNFSSKLWQIEQDGTPLNEVLEKVFNQKTANALKRLNLFTTAQLTSTDGSELITWSQFKLCRKQFRRGRKPRWFIVLENCLIGDRRNRKLIPEYVIPGYNSLALSIELLAVSFDKRKKELVLVKNKNDDRKIFKIVQKDKTKIFGEHYCNIPLADPNQFEIKKYKGCSGNTAKITGKVNEELKQNFGYAAKKLYQGRKEDFELE
ncbi:29971_t:CDS:2 [Gigaspora margarita]|uniref:29971_t:CDS:1 n=1 Tax=Gigaspora margarita TaxID=4874 RepID=A0ABN7UXY1_GIGMA|nr:29971_t:CDS:2 [Gigaspora margarita]